VTSRPSGTVKSSVGTKVFGAGGGVGAGGVSGGGFSAGEGEWRERSKMLRVVGRNLRKKVG
jgi:hypothetical protein